MSIHWSVERFWDNLKISLYLYEDNNRHFYYRSYWIASYFIYLSKIRPINKWWKYQNWHQAQPLKCLYVLVLQLLASTSTQTTIGVVLVAFIAKMPRLPTRINSASTVWVCRPSNPDSGWLILCQRSRSKINVLSGAKRSLMSCLCVDARRCASGKFK